MRTDVRVRVTQADYEALGRLLSAETPVCLRELHARMREGLADEPGDLLERARAEVPRELQDELEIDDDAALSRADGEGGCWVGAWLWVPDPDEDDDEEEDA